MPNPSIDIKFDVKPSFESIGQKFKKVNLKKSLQISLEEFAFATERFSKIGAPVDTGRMRASIATDIGNLKARIAPHVFYAIFVHEGTRFMKPRPFMSIGLAQAKVKYFRRGMNPFTATIQKELNDKLK